MTRLNKIKLISSLLLSFFVADFTFADFITDEYFGYSLDIPEGYELTDMSDDTMTLMFTHPYMPVTFFIRIYPEENSYNTSDEALDATMKKLSASYESENFSWSEEQCSITIFEMTLDQYYKGWSVAAPIGHEANIVLICYSPEKDFNKCQDFMISTINSLCIKDDFYNVPGIITTFAYPDEGNQSFSTTIADKKIKSTLDKSDAYASQFVIDLEYRILNYYSQNNLWMEAWQRYYRMIYRDSYGRLKDFAQKVLDVLYPLSLKVRPDNPDIQFAQYILSWVQNFEYVRASAQSESDFSNLPSVLLGSASDCDNRSLLVCLLLEYAGIDSMLLVSPPFAHAMAATDIEAPGQTFQNPDNGRNYIAGETTTQITWGMIPQEMADRNKWFFVTFP